MFGKSKTNGNDTKGTKSSEETDINDANSPETSDGADAANIADDCEASDVDYSAEGGEAQVQVVELTKKLCEAEKKSEEYYNALQRSAAEFDNFRRRSRQEKEGIYSDCTKDVVSAFLPVADTLERAIMSMKNTGADEAVISGMEMVLKQFSDVLSGQGVSVIETKDQTFDPVKHNAVMHIEDEAFGEGVIVEEFQKGYMIGDKVIRHSMVKVAN